MSFIRSFTAFLSAFGEITRSPPLFSAFETAAAASSEPRPSGLSGFPCEREKEIPRLTYFLLFEKRELFEVKKWHSYSLVIGSTKAIGAKPTLVSLVSTIIPIHIRRITSCLSFSFSLAHCRSPPHSLSRKLVPLRLSIAMTLASLLSQSFVPCIRSIPIWFSFCGITGASLFCYSQSFLVNRSSGPIRCYWIRYDLVHASLEPSSRRPMYSIYETSRAFLALREESTQSPSSLDLGSKSFAHFTLTESRLLIGFWTMFTANLLAA